MENQGIIRDYFENLYSNKFENLEEMDKFLEIMTNQNWTKSILITWIDLQHKMKLKPQQRVSPTKKSPEPDDSQLNSIRPLKKN
jgi:hypothetical protein